MSMCDGPRGRKIMITDLWRELPDTASARKMSASVKPPIASEPNFKNPRREMPSHRQYGRPRMDNMLVLLECLGGRWSFDELVVLIEVGLHVEIDRKHHFNSTVTL